MKLYDDYLRWRRSPAPFRPRRSRSGSGAEERGGAGAARGWRRRGRARSRCPRRRGGWCRDPRALRSARVAVDAPQRLVGLGDRGLAGTLGMEPGALHAFEGTVRAGDGGDEGGEAAPAHGVAVGGARDGSAARASGSHPVPGRGGRRRPGCLRGTSSVSTGAGLRRRRPRTRAGPPDQPPGPSAPPPAGRGRRGPRRGRGRASRRRCGGR